MKHVWLPTQCAVQMCVIKIQKLQHKVLASKVWIEASLSSRWCRAASGFNCCQLFAPGGLFAKSPLTAPCLKAELFHGVRLLFTPEQPQFNPSASSQ